MRWPWRKRKSGERDKKKVVLPEELAMCVKRILEEKETQCKFNSVPFEGMTLEEISKEVCLRLGNDWTIDELRKSGLKL